jgi:hypothetical protein
LSKPDDKCENVCERTYRTFIESWVKRILMPSYSDPREQPGLGDRTVGGPGLPTGRHFEERGEHRAELGFGGKRGHGGITKSETR